jgi:hypothetical protein
MAENKQSFKALSLPRFFFYGILMRRFCFYMLGCGTHDAFSCLIRTILHAQSFRRTMAEMKQVYAWPITLV